MARRKRTLLNAPTGRTHTAPPARERGNAPSVASEMAYAEPSDDLEPDDLVDAPPAGTEEDIPTEVAPRPYDKAVEPGNPSPAPDERLDHKPAAPANDLAARPPAPPADERVVPAVVMVGVAGVLVLLLAALLLAFR
ncbi:MAG: hypothetical protein KC656_02880 [Myxococcales bacterium]|nr:hypothetical protein [Myxococcales bacterium]MCB9671879.1 hypothetical protein [Alphaproteobacteria bacterium]MCB9693851.1 hypothetical protein [Alphaproteobacteria bacterium]